MYYNEKYSKENIDVEGFDEATHKFMESLNKEQKSEFFDLEVFLIEYRRLHELRVINFILELLNPEEV